MQAVKGQNIEHIAFIYLISSNILTITTANEQYFNLIFCFYYLYNVRRLDTEQLINLHFILSLYSILCLPFLPILLDTYIIITVTSMQFNEVLMFALSNTQSMKEKNI